MDDFYEHVIADIGFISFIQLPYVGGEKFRRDDEVPHVDDEKFDTILENDVTEHNLNYRDIKIELKRVIMSEELLKVSLHREYFHTASSLEWRSNTMKEASMSTIQELCKILFKVFITKPFKLMKREGSLKKISVLLCINSLYH